MCKHKYAPAFHLSPPSEPRLEKSPSHQGISRHSIGHRATSGLIIQSIKCQRRPHFICNMPPNIDVCGMNERNLTRSCSSPDLNDHDAAPRGAQTARPLDSIISVVHCPHPPISNFWHDRLGARFMVTISGSSSSIDVPIAWILRPSPAFSCRVPN